jgi:hypothetical protein
MLEHQKIVLNGVKNNKKLFRKELIKSLAWLNNNEQTQLRKWVKENFICLHAEIIMDVFHHNYQNAS